MAALTAACVAGPRHAGSPSAPAIELLGKLDLPPDASLDAIPVGGLSAIAREDPGDTYLALSDDRGEHGPPRVYRLRLTFGDPSEARVLSWWPLRDATGDPLADGVADPEGLALPGDGSLMVVSEGLAGQGVAPFLRRFSDDGSLLSVIDLPRHFAASPTADWGVRDNLGFESLTLAPAEGRIYLATESALVQDGPTADLGTASKARLLVLSWPDGRVLAEHLYPLEPLGLTPRPPEAFRVGGLVELLFVAPGRLLALERQFAVGDGYSLRLYALGLAGASDLQSMNSLAEERNLEPVCKELLLDFDSLDFEPRNLEGLAWGPVLADGRRTLVVVEDDNFDNGPAARFLLLAPRRRSAASWLPLARRCW